MAWLHLLISIDDMLGWFTNLFEIYILNIFDKFKS